MSWASHSFSFRGPRGRLKLFATIAVIVSALVVFEAVLLESAAPKPTGSVTGAQVKYVDEGNTALGNPWFGAQEINYSGAFDGYPFAYQPGATFNFSLQPANRDNASHTISSVLVNAPFTVVRSSPAVPYDVEAGGDLLLMITVGAPPTVGTYALNVTVVVGS